MAYNSRHHCLPWFNILSIPWFCRWFSNFVRLGSNSMIWHQQQKAVSNFLTSIISLSKINVGTTSSVLNIALPGDKGVILYINKLSHLKHLSNGIIKKVFETANTGLTLSDDYQYKFELSCLCVGVSSFWCFSSSWSCLILKTADSVCLAKEAFKPWLLYKDKLIYKDKLSYRF